MRASWICITLTAIFCAWLPLPSLSAESLKIHIPANAPNPQSSEVGKSTQDSRLVTTDSGILPADVAFSFTGILVGNQTILLNWLIEPGYYLYQSKLELIDNSGKHLAVELPAAQLLTDQFLGKSLVYFNSLQLRLPVKLVNRTSSGVYDLEARFQGCAKDRFCYPPLSRRIHLNAPQ